MSKHPPKVVDGWTRPRLSTQWHYFRDRESLCGLWAQPRDASMIMEIPEVDPLPPEERCQSCRLGAKRLSERWVNLAPVGKTI